MDQNNLTHEEFTTEIVLRWIVMLKECGPGIKYIKGRDNDTAYTFSKLPLIKFEVNYSNITREYLAASYCVDKLDSNTFPLP